MGIVDEDIERVKSLASIVDIVQGEGIALRKSGTMNWLGLCPFHPDRTPSFNVSDKLSRYKCFACDAGGDVIKFVQEFRHVDFVEAVEFLAGRVGIQLNYDTNTEGRDRGRRKRLIEAVNAAAVWYHERLLKAPDAGPARSYLRDRGFTGDTVRQFQLGWAPDGWDALSTGAGIERDLLRETGLAFVNKAQRLQDTFRARVLFPIRSDNGDAVAFGGRILPGSTDPAKYKNSPETPVYTKSKTLYGLDLAKADIVRSEQVVVCEGYTDVIGFHRAGVPRAVATCGTALTEDHVRLLKKFSRNIVLAFDADAAGQGAAERFYEWEKKLDVSVSVARLPPGSDPADLARRDPEALKDSVHKAEPFLQFRLGRVLRAGDRSTNENKVRLAEQAMTVINEHPDPNVRALYAGQVATHTGLNAADLQSLAKRRGPVRIAPVREQRRAERENAETVMLALLVQRWDDTAEWLIEELFTDEVVLSAFRSLADTDGDFEQAMEIADAEARDLLERAAVFPTDADPAVEARNLIGASTRRAVSRLASTGDLTLLGHLQDAKMLLATLDQPGSETDSALSLLAWLTHEATPDST